MTITVGRLTLDEYETMDYDGHTLSLSGQITGASVAAAVALRDQVRGLRSPWEQVVPVIDTEDSTLTGFYTVADASASAIEVSLATGVFEYQLELEAVPAGPSALSEVYVDGVGRTQGGTMSVTPDYWHAVPSDAVGYTAKYSAIDHTRTGPGGAVKWYTHASYASTPSTFRFRLAPADWYDAGCSITVGGYTVVGQVHQNNVSTWEISNGLLKIGPGTGGLLAVTAPSSTPANWGTAVHWKVGYWDGAAFQSITSISRVQVVKNTADQCVLRLSCYGDVAANQSAEVTVDVSMQRGSRTAQLVVTSHSSQKWGVSTVASTAATALTATIATGFHATANDGDTNRACVFTSKIVTQSVAGPSYLYLTTASTLLDVGIGAEYGGSGSAGNEAVAQLRDQYFALMNLPAPVLV